jgi:hypothetical protein
MLAWGISVDVGRRLRVEVGAKLCVVAGVGVSSGFGKEIEVDIGLWVTAVVAVTVCIMVGLGLDMPNVGKLADLAGCRQPAENHAKNASIPNKTQYLNRPIAICAIISLLPTKQATSLQHKYATAIVHQINLTILIHSEG